MARPMTTPTLKPGDETIPSPYMIATAQTILTP